MNLVGVAENHSYTVGGGHSYTPTTPTASKIPLPQTPTNSRTLLQEFNKANNHVILIYITLKMNILYNNNIGLRKVPKWRFAGVWECRSGFFKIFC